MQNYEETDTKMMKKRSREIESCLFFFASAFVPFCG